MYYRRVCKPKFYGGQILAPESSLVPLVYKVLGAVLVDSISLSAASESSLLMACSVVAPHTSNLDILHAYLESKVQYSVARHVINFVRVHI